MKEETIGGAGLSIKSIKKRNYLRQYDRQAVSFLESLQEMGTISASLPPWLAGLLCDL